jgi:hypothetical protein
MKTWTEMPLAAATAVLLLGCGESFSPSVDNVSGDYHASVLTATQGASTVNFLQSGGSLEITLNPDGSTSGRLFLPGGAENGADLDVDLAGTWTLTGSSVFFAQQGDTFIRDVPFTASRNRLSAENTFNPGTPAEFTIRAVLTK